MSFGRAPLESMKLDRYQMFSKSPISGQRVLEISFLLKVISNPLLNFGSISGGSLEDGRIMADVPPHLSASAGQMYGGSAVVVVPAGPRSSGSSSTSSQSSPTDDHHHNGSNGKMAASNGTGSGRKYQCKMCPQVNKYFNYCVLVMHHPLSCAQEELFLSGVYDDKMSNSSKLVRILKESFLGRI